MFVLLKNLLLTTSCFFVGLNLNLLAAASSNGAARGVISDDDFIAIFNEVVMPTGTVLVAPPNVPGASSSASYTPGSAPTASTALVSAASSSTALADESGSSRASNPVRKLDWQSFQTLVAPEIFQPLVAPDSGGLPDVGGSGGPETVRALVSTCV